jgi:prevent-host-death family protein
MKHAAVAELKASLSRYLAGVKAGDEVVITERGKPIAKIVPMPAGGNDEERRLRELESRGLVRLGTGRLPRAFWNMPRASDPAAEIRRALVEEREQSR